MLVSLMAAPVSIYQSVINTDPTICKSQVWRPLTLITTYAFERLRREFILGAKRIPLGESPAVNVTRGLTSPLYPITPFDWRYSPPL